MGREFFVWQRRAGADHAVDAVFQPVRPEHFRVFLLFFGQTKTVLPPAHQFQINIGQKLGIKNAAVQFTAAGSISKRRHSASSDAGAPGNFCRAIFQTVNNPFAVNAGIDHFQFGIDEFHIEFGVMRHRQLAVCADEVEKIAIDLRKDRFVFHKIIGNAACTAMASAGISRSGLIY